jgi:hypothetical protein
VSPSVRVLLFSGIWPIGVLCVWWLKSVFKKRKGRESNGSDRGAETDYSDSEADDTESPADGAAGKPTSKALDSGVTLPVVARDTPIVTWKQARLVRDGCDVRLLALSTDYKVRADAEASCLRKSENPIWGMPVMTLYLPYVVNTGTTYVHGPPGLDCTCGFYAYVHRPAPEYSIVVLEVELSGRVIEHETGYRAQFQRVLGCYLPPRCHSGLLCDGVPVAVYFGGDNKGHGICERHAKGDVSDLVVSLAKLSGAIGIECRWDHVENAEAAEIDRLRRERHRDASQG